MITIRPGISPQSQHKSIAPCFIENYGKNFNFFLDNIDFLNMFLLHISQKYISLTNHVHVTKILKFHNKCIFDTITISNITNITNTTKLIQNISNNS